jgi:hypothetical protein
MILENPAKMETNPASDKPPPENKKNKKLHQLIFHSNGCVGHDK